MSATIFAEATAPGRAGVAIIRVSGPEASALVARLTGQPCPPPRMACLRTLRDPATGRVLDQALVLFFPGPDSFTGEDVAEFHVHGSRAVVTSLSEALEGLGARLAAPGEFSKRAVLNGKMDLTAAEAVADLVAAETAAQQDQALAQAGGALARLYEQWRHDLLQALAYWEASLDFADEDLPADLVAQRMVSIDEVARAMTAHLADAKRGERVRNGVSIVLIGPPNAGKSSLLNALAGRDAAIVSARAGTTRDIVEIHLDLGGFPVVIADTAGLRTTDDDIEQEGVARARARAASADLKIAVFAADAPEDPVTQALIDDDTLVVINKIDMAASQTLPTGCAVSVKTGQGLPAFLETLTDRVKNLLKSETYQAPPTRIRHIAHLQESLNALKSIENSPQFDLKTENLRLAVQALGRITGRVDIEDILDVIFRDFCIGK